MQFNTLVLVLLILCIANVKAFDYYALPMNWPGGSCTKKSPCCFPSDAVTKDFYIHSLWPENNDGSYPTYCRDKEFDPSELINNGLNWILETEWPAVTCPSSSGKSYSPIWKEDWLKHGTCCQSFQNKYFSLALSLASSVNPLAYLLSAGIIPSDSAKYEYESVKKALKAATGGHDVAVVCYSGNLRRVIFCFDKYPSLISCPDVYKSSCPKKIKFTPYAASNIISEVV